MAKDYMPSEEAKLVTWLKNYKDCLNAGAERFGLELYEADEASHHIDLFAAAYQKANEPMTRSPGNVEIKDTAKAAAVEVVRRQVRRVQASTVIDDDKRKELGVTVPKATRTPATVPVLVPRLDVLAVDGHLAFCRVDDPTTQGRARPVGTDGAMIFRYVGDEPPLRMEAWQFAQNARRRDFTMAAPSSAEPGQKVWLSAAWFNDAGLGPACAPVKCHVGYDGARQAA